MHGRQHSTTCLAATLRPTHTHTRTTKTTWKTKRPRGVVCAMSSDVSTSRGGGAAAAVPAASSANGDAAAHSAPSLEPRVKVFRFTGSVPRANLQFNCQVTFLKDSFMVWVGPTTAPAALPNLTLSMPTRFSKVPSTAAILREGMGSAAGDQCEQFSQKLSQALAAPVFATYTLPEMPGLAEAVTLQVLEKVRGVLQHQQQQNGGVAEGGGAAEAAAAAAAVEAVPAPGNGSTAATAAP